LNISIAADFCILIALIIVHKLTNIQCNRLTLIGVLDTNVDNQTFWKLIEPVHAQTRVFCRKLAGNKDDGDVILMDSNDLNIQILEDSNISKLKIIIDKNDEDNEL